MIYLFEKELPDTVTVNGSSFLINTDYRVWLKYIVEVDKASEIYDPDLTFVFNYPQHIRKHIVITEPLFNALHEFCNKDSIYPKSTTSNNVRITDYVQDGPFIYSAFMSKYHIDLLDVDMHWYKFKALLQGITCDYADIISSRTYDGKDSKLLAIKNEWSVVDTAKIETQKKIEKQVYDYLIKLSEKKGG